MSAEIIVALTIWWTQKDIRDIRKDINTIKTKITNFAERVGNLEGSFSEHMWVQHNVIKS